MTKNYASINKAYAVPHVFLQSGGNCVRTNMVTQHPVQVPRVLCQQPILAPEGLDPLATAAQQMTRQIPPEKCLMKHEEQESGYPQGFRQQPNCYLGHQVYNGLDHQVNNGFVRFPQEMVPVHQGQYQTHAPHLIPAAMADRDAQYYPLPGYMTCGAGQPAFVPAANLNPSTIFQSGQVGYPGYTASVIPATGLQQSQSGYGSLPVCVSGSVRHPAYVPSLTRESSEPRRDHFFQTGEQRITHGLDAGPQDEAIRWRANPAQRVGVTSLSYNQELMNSNARSHARRNMEVNRVQNPRSEVHKENGDQTGNKLATPNQKPGKEWRYDPDRWVIVSALCNALEQMCHVNKNREKTEIPQVKSKFHATTVPAISLAAYLKRIAWFFECSKECFVLALEYIHRLVKNKPDVEVNYNTVHHLLITCIKVSAKFFDDKRIPGRLYAQVVGLPTATIAAFEVEFVFFLNFHLYVQPEQYQTRYNAMLTDNQGPSKITIQPEDTWQN